MRVHAAKARTACTGGNRRLLTVTIAMLAAAAFVACAGAFSTVARAASTRTVGANSNGKTIALTRGARLAVSLQEGSDGGYRWVVITPPKASVLKILSNRSIPPSLAPGEVGGMSTRQLLLKATGLGTAKLKLLQLGPGETVAKHSAHDEAFAVTVRVR